MKKLKKEIDDLIALAEPHTARNKPVYRLSSKEGDIRNLVMFCEHIRGMLADTLGETEIRILKKQFAEYRKRVEYLIKK